MPESHWINTSGNDLVDFGAKTRKSLNQHSWYRFCRLLEPRPETLNQYFWDRFCRLPGKLHGFAVKITLFWSSKNHYVLLHKRLGSKLVPGKLHGFDMKISFSWSSNNHCVLLHKRLGSKILPGKLNGFAMKIILFWSSKYDCVLLHKTRVKTNFRKTQWFCFENHSLLKFWNHCVLLHKRLGSNIFPGKVNGCAMKITLFWSSKNRCAFLHTRLGSKLVPRKRNGFAIKITFFWSSKTHCILLHTRLWSKIVLGFAMKIILFWSAEKHCVFITEKTRLKNNSLKAWWFRYKIHPLLEL